MTATDDIKKEVSDNERNLAVHEAVCAERYKGIQESLERGARRMRRMEYLIYLLGLIVMFGPVGAIKVIEALGK